MVHNIRETLELAHQLLANAEIDHALIGGLALSEYGINRATMDVDFLADGAQKTQILEVLQSGGFELVMETTETLHFAGYGYLDILLANRKASKKMLGQAESRITKNVKSLNPEDIIGLKIQAYVNDPQRLLQDQADIAAIIRTSEELDWVKIKSHADLFNQWDNIEKLKTENKL